TAVAFFGVGTGFWVCRFSLDFFVFYLDFLIINLFSLKLLALGSTLRDEKNDFQLKTALINTHELNLLLTFIALKFSVQFLVFM
ncbi:MAG: hypothetical protein R3Y27_09105, partial [Clostridia bacterium]